MSMTATYSPEDNKLRLYSSTRLTKDLYDRVKAAGFKWAPKQELFVAPMWTPGREDFLLELCEEIEDEDTTLVDRAEERSERFSDYSDKRAEDAARAHKAVEAITEHIPLGPADPYRPPLRTTRQEGRRTHPDRHAPRREDVGDIDLLDRPRSRCAPSCQVQGASRRSRPSHQDARGRQAQAGTAEAGDRDVDEALG